MDGKMWQVNDPISRGSFQFESPTHKRRIDIVFYPQSIKGIVNFPFTMKNENKIRTGNNKSSPHSILIHESLYHMLLYIICYIISYVNSYS